MLTTLGTARASILDDTPGVVYHLDAAAGVTLTGAAVSAWQSQSTGGLTFAQTSSAKQPTFITGATTGNINGRPVIRFDGDTSGSTGNPIVAVNADELVLPTSTLNQTVFVVNRSTSSVAPDGMWGDENADKGLRRSGTGGWSHPGNVDDFTNTGSMFINGVATNVAPDGAAHILSGTRSSAITFNDTSIGDYFQVGTNGARSWSGDVAEVAVYNRLLTDSERTAIESFLGNKYGIAVVPEPGSIGALALGGLLLARRRRR